MTNDPLFFLRHLDLALLVIALPVFLIADWPIAGWAAATFAWVVQKAIGTWANRKARETDDLKRMAGIMTGSMIGRGWLVALTILAVGLGVDDQSGLAAGVLFLVIFTVWFSTSFILRPFDTHQPTT
jgi:cytochrome b subunit of formate dehydrogenase